MRIHRSWKIAGLLVASALVSLPPHRALAHCDSLDGPVIQDARQALEKGDPAPVLKWVDKEHENEIRTAFEQTMTVRGKGEEARALADRFFFETLVRIHRAGEGEAFTGLKPASVVDPGIAGADKALQSGSADELARRMSSAVADGISKRFALAMQKKKHVAESVEAGREYVAAYVDYIHFVESVNRIASHGVSHRHSESDAHAE